MDPGVECVIKRISANTAVSKSESNPGSTLETFVAE